MTTTFVLRALTSAVLCSLGAGCAAAVSRHAHPPLAERRAQHVVVISIDGLRPSAIEAAGARTLRALVREGAYSLEARTILPSKTLPSHTSMVTGVSPVKHGITWNEDRVSETGRVRVPTIFDLADSAGLEVAAFFGKAKFRHLVGSGRPEFWATAPRGYEVLSAARMAEDVRRYLKYRDPDLLFVHISEPDIAGHVLGWMSLPYRIAVRRADAAVREVLLAARERFGEDMVLIVTADHGGSGRDHGSESAVDMTIPWIAWGEGVVPGPIRAPITTYDTAATVLWLLGVPRPDFWDGRPVTSAFGAPQAAM
ncbi:MAG TPA: ectonucleotide pyrophosphatase/phosphodiesterase [Longimicrobiaceae bacterium]|nr:ectonucleotide pyrophosphatase/phosphodiesterase [Longimicrobiaceae bacterium]